MTEVQNDKVQMGKCYNRQDLDSKDFPSFSDLFELLKKLLPGLFGGDDEEEAETEKTKSKYIPLGVQASGAPRMWKKGLSGKGIKVAVLDTGILDHPDLNKNVVKRVDYTEDSNPDWDIHGTHVAGTIAANGKILGVAPDVSLLDYRVLGSDGSGSFADVAKAVRDAADECDIINMSLGGPSDFKPLREAIEYAHSKNVVVVVAAGNEGDGLDFTPEFGYPGMYPEVKSIGSARFDKLDTAPSDFSNSNKEVDFCAHGEDVISTGKNQRYASLSGTSMAAPHVAGMAAIILQKLKEDKKEYTTEQIYAVLRKLSKDIYLPGKDNTTGYGFVTFSSEL